MMAYSRLTTRKLFVRLLWPVCAIVVACVASKAQADEVFINEVFSDPGSAGAPVSDLREEYIELRGTPGMSLENMFLIFVENENNIANNGNAGLIDNIFFLGDDPNTVGVEAPYQLGANGYLVMRQRDAKYTTIAPGTTVVTNMFPHDENDPFLGAGWGHGTMSTIRAYDELGEGKIENGGYTAMLVRNISEPVGHWPTIGMDLDNVGNTNNGLDFLDTSGPNWQIHNPDTGLHWEILDAIGATTEFDELFSRLYGKVNFGAVEGASIEAPETGATFTFLDYELEYVGRWGNSTGQTEKDWMVGNFSLNAVGAGSAGINAPGGPDWRQSCLEVTGDCHPTTGSPDTPPPPGIPTESNRGVPYGTQMANTLGAPNFLIGDYNKDGFVNSADYTEWRNSIGQIGSDAADLPADGNHDYLINMADFPIWKAAYGQPPAAGSGAGAGMGSQVPEPGGALLASIALSGLLSFARRRLTKR
jgi:hypothetical protein